MIKKEKLISIIFIVFLVAPSILFYIFKDKVNTTNYENRALAEKPNLSISNWRNIPSEVDNYVNDHAPFKNQFVNLNSIIDVEAFKSISSNKVILGKDKWLFYKSLEDGDPMKCYQGTNPFSEEDLEKIKNNLIEVQNNLAKQNKEFILFIAPNKEQVYSEYMPSYIKVINEYRRVDQLIDYIKKNTSIKVIYPKDELLEAKKEYDIYHKYDTHWNSVGAFVGCQQINEELTGKRKYLGEVKVTNGGDTENDLAGMINLKSYLSQESGPRVLNYNDGLIVNEEKKQDIRYNKYTSNAEDKRKVLLIRDSFGAAMFDFVPKEFQQVTFIHRGDFNNSILKEENPDIVIYEIVERYLHELTNSLEALKK